MSFMIDNFIDNIEKYDRYKVTIDDNYELQEEITYDNINKIIKEINKHKKVEFIKGIDDISLSKNKVHNHKSKKNKRKKR